MLLEKTLHARVVSRRAFEHDVVEAFLPLLEVEMDFQPVPKLLQPGDERSRPLRGSCSLECR